MNPKKSFLAIEAKKNIRSLDGYKVLLFRSRNLSLGDSTRFRQPYSVNIELQV